MKDILMNLFIIGVFGYVAIRHVINLCRAKNTGIIKPNAMRSFTVNKQVNPKLFKFSLTVNIFTTIFFVLLAIFVTYAIL